MGIYAGARQALWLPDQLRASCVSGGIHVPKLSSSSSPPPGTAGDEKPSLWEVVRPRRVKDREATPACM